MIDTLWHGGPRFKDLSGVFRLGTDSVLLAYFAEHSAAIKQTKAADLGCGSGIISILLAWERPHLHVDGIELQADAARLAAENAELCGLSERINITQGDIRNYKQMLIAGAYDLTISNPPYYAKGSGKLPNDNALAAARAETFCTLENICEAAGYITKWGGAFMLVHKPERLSDLFRCLSSACFEPKRIRFVQHKSASPPNLVLIESRRGGKPSLNVEAPLILANDDGSDSDEVKRIYRR